MLLTGKSFAAYVDFSADCTRRERELSEFAIVLLLLLVLVLVLLLILDVENVTIKGNEDDCTWEVMLFSIPSSRVEVVPSGSQAPVWESFGCKCVPKLELGN